jgi:hypothetical protein
MSVTAWRRAVSLTASSPPMARRSSRSPRACCVSRPAPPPGGDRSAHRFSTHAKRRSCARGSSRTTQLCRRLAPLHQKRQKGPHGVSAQNKRITHSLNAMLLAAPRPNALACSHERRCPSHRARAEPRRPRSIARGAVKAATVSRKQELQAKGGQVSAAKKNNKKTPTASKTRARMASGSSASLAMQSHCVRANRESGAGRLVWLTVMELRQTQARASLPLA